MRFIVAVVACVLVVGCPGSEPVDPPPLVGPTPDAIVPGQAGDATPVHPTCAFGGRVATSQAEALSQWGEPCSTDVLGDVSVWYYRTTRCRLETMPGPLDDFCLNSCSSSSPLHPVTFEKTALIDCRPSPQQAVPPPHTYTITRYAHHDAATTALGALCPGSTTLVGGSCGCSTTGAVSNGELTGERLNVMSCTCSSPGVSVYLACLSSNASGTVVDGTP